VNNRRKLVIALGAAALTTPFGAIAQKQGKIWRIGFLSENEKRIAAPAIEAFKSGLRELGHIDFVIEERYAQNDFARLPALVAELVALQVDVMLPSGTPSALAIHNFSRDIPIVIAIVGDPVGSGLAASLRHPGGRVTGLSNISAELVSKRLDLLRQIVPGLRRAAFFYNPDSVNDVLGLKQFESTCAKLGIKAIPTPVRSNDEIAAAFNVMKREKAQGLIVSATNAGWRPSIVSNASNNRLPAIYAGRTWPEAGGLFSYAANNPDLYRRAAAYVDKIFKGSKPGDLPIEQPTKFDAIINLKTAKALGIKIPNSILVQATEVIE
jgi:putative ABC transport system substrate-binding protein